MSGATHARGGSVFQSPWFWAHLFCASGVAALVLAGGKVTARQSQIESEAHGRLEAAAHRRAGTSPASSAEASAAGPGADVIGQPRPPAEAKPLAVSARPLIFVLGGGMVVSWAGLWWTRFRPPTRAPK